MAVTLHKAPRERAVSLTMVLQRVCTRTDITKLEHTRKLQLQKTLRNRFGGTLKIGGTGRSMAGLATLKVRVEKAKTKPKAALKDVDIEVRYL